MALKKKIRILPIGIFIISIFLFNKLISFVFSFSENSQAFLNNVSVAFAESVDHGSKKNFPSSGNDSNETQDVEVIVDENKIEKKITDDDEFQEIILDYSNYEKKEKSDKVGFKNHYDQEEIQLLEQLRQKREKLEIKEAEIKKKESLLLVTERRVNKKIDELNHLKAEIQKKIKTLNEDQERQIHSLVKTYEAMKPKSAAGIFNELDMGVLIEIVDRMKDAKKAPVLAIMNPERVTLITSILATRKKIPD